MINADFRSGLFAHIFHPDIFVFLAKSAIPSHKLWGLFFSIRSSRSMSFRLIASATVRSTCRFSPLFLAFSAPLS